MSSANRAGFAEVKQHHYSCFNHRKKIWKTCPRHGGKKQARKHMEHFKWNGETGKGRKWIWGFKSAAKSFIKPANCQQRKKGISSHIFFASLNKVSFQALPVKAWQQNCHQRIINIFKKEDLERSSISSLITVLVSRQYLGTWASAMTPPQKILPLCMLESHHLRNTTIFSKSVSRQFWFHNSEK